MNILATLTDLLYIAHINIIPNHHHWFILCFFYSSNLNSMNSSLDGLSTTLNFPFLFPYFPESLMGSASEDEEDEEPHIRGPPLGLGPLTNGPDSGTPLGQSDLSVQSISTDSKTGHDDSDQVINSW